MRSMVFCVVAALLSACATPPSYTDADDRALDPSRTKYQACVRTQLSAVINGSDDVQFLVNYVVGQCDKELQPVSTYLRGRGFTEPFIQDYLASVRREARQVTAGVILRIKAQHAPASR
jgi:hypothetical protein